MSIIIVVAKAVIVGVGRLVMTLVFVITDNTYYGETIKIMDAIEVGDKDKTFKVGDCHIVPICR